MNRPQLMTSNTAPMAIRPAAMTGHPNGMNYSNPARLQMTQNQTPYTLQMLQDTNSFAFSGFGNSTGTYGGNQTENSLTMAKEEPRDDLFFDSFLS